MTMDMQDFQNLGEPIRRQCGIDGTAGDAQDVHHPFTPHEGLDSHVCVACGLTDVARVHDQSEDGR